MEPLNRFAAPSDTLKRLFELRQVLDFDHQVEFAETWWCQAKFATGEAPAFDQSLLFEVAHVAGDVLGEYRVADARLQIAKRVIDVHTSSALHGRTGERSLVDLQPVIARVRRHPAIQAT